MARERVLIAGFATRHVAESAKKAGFIVGAVDHFCDRDLVRAARICRSFEDLDTLEIRISDTLHEFDADWFVPTSGAELLSPPVRRLGSDPGTQQTFLDKRLTSVFFLRHGIPAPALLPPLTYPAFVKPSSGSGGWRNAVVKKPDEEMAWSSLYPEQPYIRQQVLRGFPASVCCVADGSQAVAVATNEQILRGTPEAPYGFAGSVTPLSHPLAEDLALCAEKIASASGLKGCIGIDFLVTSGGFRAIEVNPRFQGTLDTVEPATGQNLFRLHYNACHGRLPEARPEPVRFAARKILFAEGCQVTGGAFRDWRPGFVSDIPWPDSVFFPGDAVISVTATGRTRGGCLDRLHNHITAVRQRL